MEKKFNQFEYNNQFNKEHYKRVTILVPQTNKEMLKWLEKNKPVSSYILDLIQEDMQKKKQ